MDLKTFIADESRRAALVSALGTSDGYLWQLANGWRGRRPSAEFALRIEAATFGQVSRAELRPDLWGAQPHEAGEVTGYTVPVRAA